MEVSLQAVLCIGLLLVVSPVKASVHNGRCGPALEDIPDPASDSCVAFFRCYSNRQFSIRCPLGQAFHFDRARCRPESEVDCPLQLQRFQAPAVPHYLRPNQAHHDREVEIRVVHVAPNTAASSNQVANSGQDPVLRQTASQVGGQILSAGQLLQPVAQVGGQQTPVWMRTASGQLIQVERAAGHLSQVGSQQTPVWMRTGSGQLIQIEGAAGHFPQAQFLQHPAPQHVAGLGVQGQHAQYPSQYDLPSQPVQGQHLTPPQQGQTLRDQTGTGSVVSGPAVQGQNVVSSHQNPPSHSGQELNAPPLQQNIQSANLPSPPLQQNTQSANLPSQQNAQSQGLPNPAQVTQVQKFGSNTQQNSSSQFEGQSNLAIFSPSSDGTAKSSGDSK
ncbi:hypothetical protein BsWGS_26389 [Bradybaena similaris]